MTEEILDLKTVWSDGDSSHWPVSTDYIRDDEPYLKKVANLYAKKFNEQYGDGSFKLARLPKGYACFKKYRMNPPTAQDYYIFGHPKGKFDSVVKFFVHFLSLMNKNDSDPCSCVNCDLKSVGRRSTRRINNDDSKNRSSNSSRQSWSEVCGSTARVLVPSAATLGLPQGRLPSPPQAIEDDFDQLMIDIEHLSATGRIEQSLEDAEDPTTITCSLEQILAWQTRPAYCPRVGELILFASNVHASEILV